MAIAPAAVSPDRYDHINPYGLYQFHIEHRIPDTHFSPGFQTPTFRGPGFHCKEWVSGSTGMPSIRSTKSTASF